MHAMRTYYVLPLSPWRQQQCWVAACALAAVTLSSTGSTMVVPGSKRVVSRSSASSSKLSWCAPGKDSAMAGLQTKCQSGLLSRFWDCAYCTTLRGASSETNHMVSTWFAVWTRESWGSRVHQRCNASQKEQVDFGRRGSAQRCSAVQTSAKN